jgi:hypothetical protein
LGVIVIADLDTLLTALYVELTDRIIPSLGFTRSGPGKPPEVTGAELVCLAVAQVMLRYDDERHWLRAAPKLAGRFPPAAGAIGVQRAHQGRSAADRGRAAMAGRSHPRLRGAAAADGRHPRPVRPAGDNRPPLGPVVAGRKAAGHLVPGLGHPVHKDGDPRTPRIIGIAREEGLYGPHLALFEAIGRVHPKVLGKQLPLNGAGVSGAALADLGLPQELLRGVVLLARCAGLLGHIAEEIRQPVANSVYMTVDRNAEYVPPAPRA